MLVKWASGQETELQCIKVTLIPRHFYGNYFLKNLSSDEQLNRNH